MTGSSQACDDDSNKVEPEFHDSESGGQNPNFLGSYNDSRDTSTRSGQQKGYSSNQRPLSSHAKIETTVSARQLSLGNDLELKYAQQIYGLKDGIQNRDAKIGVLRGENEILRKNQAEMGLEVARMKDRISELESSNGRLYTMANSCLSVKLRFS
jgi:hypothetical protein